jgi:diadenosine tetraphosphate (Ap4A) HIT family hydrolase
MPRAALLGFSFLSDCGTCKSIAFETAYGGCIHRTEHWFVDHCIGPLGVGTLIIKPNRHVVHVSDLQAAEAAELGVVLQQAAAVVTALERPEQVYVTLWSHMHAVPGHIHFVVQPVTRARMDEHEGRHGVRLQVEMFDRRISPDPAEAAAFADRAREAWPS